MCVCVCLQVNAGDHYRIAQQLGRINLTVTDFYVAKHDSVTIQDEPRVLRASLTVARALTTEAKEMQVRYWTACDGEYKRRWLCSACASTSVCTPVCVHLHAVYVSESSLQYADP